MGNKVIIGEQRFYKRQNFIDDIRLLINIKTVKGSLFQKVQVALTCNLSASGLQFIYNGSFPLNTMIKVNLYLPSGRKPIKILARVIRVDDSDAPTTKKIAILFEDINGIDRSLLVQYCRNIPKREIDKEYLCCCI